MNWLGIYWYPMDATSKHNNFIATFESCSSTISGILKDICIMRDTCNCKCNRCILHDDILKLSMDDYDPVTMNHYSVKGIMANSINDILHMINDNYGEEFLSDFISKFCGKLYEL